MLPIAAIVLGTLALPGVVGFGEVSWNYRRSQIHSLRGGLDPDQIQRHAYFFSEYCPSGPRVMSFGDEIMLLSQRPWSTGYKTGTQCKMNVTTKNPDVGVILRVLGEDTETCEDFLRVTVPRYDQTYLFCGPRTNVTGVSYTFSNTSVIAEWVAIARAEAEKRGHGFSMLLTAYQNECFEGQACFPCSNGLIIDQLHMCNGVDNCGDSSDEFNCRYLPEMSVKVATAFTGLAISMMILVGVLLVGLALLGTKTFKLYRERNALRQTRGGQERSLFAEGEASA